MKSPLWSGYRTTDFLFDCVFRGSRSPRPLQWCLHGCRVWMFWGKLYLASAQWRRWWNTWSQIAGRWTWRTSTSLTGRWWANRSSIKRNPGVNILNLEVLKVNWNIGTYFFLFFSLFLNLLSIFVCVGMVDLNLLREEVRLYSCTPRNFSVSLREELKRTDAIFWPSCLLVKRCGGNCACCSYNCYDCQCSPTKVVKKYHEV